MAKLNRASLKNYFKSGEKPSQLAFSNLIDSTVNILDDGLSTSEDTIFKLTANNDSGTVMSIYKKPTDKNPSWNIYLNTNGELIFRDSKEIDRMQLSSEGNINLNGEKIFLHSENITSGLLKDCIADGKWKNIISPISGIKMYEIVAVYKSGNSKNITTIQAIASHCNGRKRSIKLVRPYSFFWQNKLKLKWKVIKDKTENTMKIGLYIKSKYSNKNGIIQYRIRQIWNNE